jgi:hypothetical protein
MAKQSVVLTTPTKRFFVDMLTRDIELDDAVLDLLDNCVDGALRLKGYNANDEQPYEGFWAKLTFTNDQFTIEDNCGGIPTDILGSAFRMGRPFEAEQKDGSPTVGIYGIGMKRAIFKMGRSCVVESKTKDSGFRVSIHEDWFTKEDGDHMWELPLEELSGAAEVQGTKITVTKLFPAVAQQFGSPTGFSKEFGAKVSQYYSVLMEKGFEVFIDSHLLHPIPITFKSADFVAGSANAERIAPYIYDGNFDGVEAEVFCGFYTPYDDNTQDDPAVFTADQAGWTVICNDRVVIYKDKTMLTGWGDAAPSFHSQFRQIAGVVTFRSSRPTLLPLTTTKRGIETNSEVWMKVKQQMRNALKTFTNYTNKLKRLTKDEQTAVFARTRTVDLKSLRQAKTDYEGWKQDSKIGGKYLEPDLPKVAESNSTWIRFQRPSNEIRKVSSFLFDKHDEKPGEVGAECFDRILREAKKK